MPAKMHNTGITIEERRFLIGCFSLTQLNVTWFQGLHIHVQLWGSVVFIMIPVLLSLLLMPFCIFGIGTTEPVLKLKSPSKEQLDSGKVIFWDLDHTLYSKATGVYSNDIVRDYMVEILGLSRKDAEFIFDEYDRMFDGHVLKGLMLDYKVKPVEFEEWIDNKVNMEAVLKPNESNMVLLKKSRARNWVITNSGRAHAARVLKALDMEDLFEALIYLDYSSPEFPTLKPDVAAFSNAMRYANVSNRSDCLLVDDIKENATGACLFGWDSVHLCEPKFCVIENPMLRLWRRSDDQCDILPTIAYLNQMPILYPILFT
jgi:pyrimidine and pyridine-specific 5'-nucleotidase